MIYEWFVHFFNTGVMVSVVIALILAVRFFMVRFPKKYCYMLWSIVLLRIVCPFEITSSASVFNLLGDSWQIVGVYEQGAEGTTGGNILSETKSGTRPSDKLEDPADDAAVTVPDTYASQEGVAGNESDALHAGVAGNKTDALRAGVAGNESDALRTGVAGGRGDALLESGTGKNTDALQERGVGNVIDGAGEELSARDCGERMNLDGQKGSKGTLQGLPEEWKDWFVTYGSLVWASGVMALFFWNILLFLTMKRRVGTSILLRDNIYECSGIPSPFVMGFVKPRIYIPFRLSEKERDYIILHEKHHISRKDNFIKLIAFVILSLYWFCPLFWVAWFLMNRDMEMSCDEYVLRQSSIDIRADYSRSLLGFAVNQRKMGIGMTSFGESDARRRVKHIMASKKYRKWIGGAAVVLILAVGAICLTNARPKQAKEDVVQEEIDQADEEMEEEFPDEKTKSGKELLTGEYGVAAETTVYDYQVEVQCFMGGTDENYVFGDRLMIQTSKGEEVIDIYEVDFELGDTFYFPQDGFNIRLADYDGDGERNDFALGQGQAKTPMAGNFMKYRFFGIGKDGMITGYHLSGEDDLCIVTLPDDHSPEFPRKNGEIHYEGLGKSGVKKKQVSIIKYVTVAEAEARAAVAGTETVYPRMDQIRNNMPEEVVRELEQHGIWRISYGKTPDQIDGNLGNAERSEEITLRLDFHYEEGRLTQYVSKDYGFTDKVAAAGGDGKQTAFQFAWDFTQFVGRDDDMMTETELPKKWEGEAYQCYEDMRGAKYRIDSRINMVVEYEDPQENIAKRSNLERVPQIFGIHLSLPHEPARVPVRVLSPEADREYMEFTYKNQFLKQLVHLRCSKSKDALGQTLTKKLGGTEYWGYTVDGKEKRIRVEPYENAKGKAYIVFYWEEKEVHFWLYAKIKGEYDKTSLLGSNYVILAKEAGEIAESVKKI